MVHHRAQFHSRICHAVRFAPRLALVLGMTSCVIAHSVGAVEFEKDIKPFLEKKCLSCHNPNNTKGDLSLMATLEEEGEEPEMPEKGDPLTEAEAELLRQWIASGAEWPDGLVLHEASKANKSWWAYQPLNETRNAEGETRNSVDAFVEAR
ncbi:MAG: hypothetical protein ACC661_07995, partial [Verrucomicrobiales bacterium]